MKKFNAVLLVFVLAVFSSCNLKTYEGEMVTEKRSIGDYDKIEINGSFDVTVDPNKSSSITVTAPSDALDDVTTEVKNGKLILRLENSGFMNPDMDVVIAQNDLDQIVIHGSGSFEGDIQPKETLELVVGGSGDIKTNTAVEKLTASVSGSGDIVASGQCSILKADVSGSGDVDFSDMSTGDAVVSVSGSGGAKVNVSGNLKAAVSGSGDIEYTGNPENVDRTVSGSGEISSY